MEWFTFRGFIEGNQGAQDFREVQPLQQVAHLKGLRGTKAKEGRKKCIFNVIVHINDKSTVLQRQKVIFVKFLRMYRTLYTFGPLYFNNV